MKFNRPQFWSLFTFSTLFSALFFVQLHLVNTQRGNNCVQQKRARDAMRDAMAVKFGQRVTALDFPAPDHVSFDDPTRANEAL